MSRTRRAPGAWIDDGPANGRGRQDTHIVAVARLSELRVPSDGLTGAGRIERSQATDAQRESWTRPPTDVSPIAPVRVADLAVAQQPEEEEETDMPDEPEPAVEPPVADDLGESLAVVADALNEAMAARAEWLRATDRWEGAVAALAASWRATGLQYEDALPPDHLAAQSIELSDGTLMRAHSDGAPETIAALRELGEAVVAERRAEIAADPSTNIPESIPVTEPEPARPPMGSPEAMAESRHRGGKVNAERIASAGGGPGRQAGPGVLSRNQQRVLEETIAHDGDRKAVAAKLGLTTGNVEMVLEYIGKKGLLPLALIARLPARFAKYSGV